ncbi:MAG: URC4/urg3 family protein [bacterium]|nr:URC4/urg3 family protein [bacterium]
MINSETIEQLLSTATIRSRAERMLNLALEGGTHFDVHLDRLEVCADFVVQVIRENYPDLNIPFHSRWGHFQAGGVDRNGQLREKLVPLSPDERSRCLLDLVVVSVLLDAGAGMQWKYRESESNRSFSRSEGLAVAGFRMFMAGDFSSDPDFPWQADASGLKALTRSTLAQGFQVAGGNPLLGLEGRLGLMHALADALESQKKFFPNRRVGGLLDYYREDAAGKPLRADRILRGIQLGLGSIWPGRLEIDGFNLGDVWEYPPFGTDYVPFHKLPQWLSYSLIEPLTEAGLEIVEPGRLTGLAEYRNGGLFLDMGVLELKDPALWQEKHSPGSELIVEWRALTLALLEKLAPRIRERLGLTEARFPLGKILEGGTWSAGRKIAAEKRGDGGPPVQIQSDGTVF